MTSGGLFVRWVTWGKRKKPRRGHFSSLAPCNFSSVPAAIYSPKSVRMSSAFLGLSAGMFLSFCWYLRPWSDDESWVIYGWWNMLDLKYLSWIIWLEDAYCESLPWRPTLSFRISVQTDGGCCLVRNLIFFPSPSTPRLRLRNIPTKIKCKFTLMNRPMAPVCRWCVEFDSQSIGFFSFFKKRGKMLIAFREMNFLNIFSRFEECSRINRLGMRHHHPETVSTV